MTETSKWSARSFENIKQKILDLKKKKFDCKNVLVTLMLRMTSFSSLEMVKKSGPYERLSQSIMRSLKNVARSSATMV